jgi:hypothetical protein
VRAFKKTWNKQKKAVLIVYDKGVPAIRAELLD